MPSEYRLITLSNEELAIALASWRRVSPAFLPPGTMTVFLVTRDGLEVTIADADGATKRSAIPFAGLVEALVAFCLDSNIKLPRAAQKRAVVSEGALALEMRLDSDEAALEEATAWIPRPAKPKAWRPATQPTRL